MDQTHQVDWDPRSEEVLADQIAAYDEMRRRCPVAYSPYGNWAVLRHEDTVRILTDHETFSNAVSHHVSVPNGMDPPEHTAYRAIVNRYYTAERMAAFEPACRRIVAALVAALPRDAEVDLMAAFAEPFANQVQYAFMGWPPSLHEPLREGTKKNHRATLAMDREAMSAVALEFDSYIRHELDTRRAAGTRHPRTPPPTCYARGSTADPSPTTRSSPSCAPGRWGSWLRSPRAWASSAITWPPIPRPRRSCADNQERSSPPVTISCASTPRSSRTAA